MDFDKTTIDDKTKAVGCIHQFFRPEYSIPRQDTGNCKTCTYDPVNNPKCSGFYKITLHQVTVLDRQEDAIQQTVEVEPEVEYQL